MIGVSSRTGEGIDRIRTLLRGRTTLLAGHSGVGKSTLVTTLEPGLDLRTGTISDSHHKGRHTTTFATMYPLAEGGRIIDTPGIKGFGLIDIEGRELRHFFPEMMPAVSRLPLLRLLPHPRAGLRRARGRRAGANCRSNATKAT